MSDNCHDNGSSPGAGGPDTPTQCGTCRTRLDPGVWHPTIGHTDPNGAYRIIRFCSDECRKAWDADDEHDGEA